MTNIQYNSELQLLIITPEIMPFDDEFELWASVFLHHESLSQLQFELGADRHMMRFQYKKSGFNLNFEHYSESIWIAPEGVEAAELLPEINAILSPKI